MPAAKRSSANAEPKILRTGNLRIKKNGVLSWSWKVRSVTLTDKELATPNFKIPLDRITKLERVDVKPYCLLLQTADRRYLLSFENDSDLYDWQEDVYSRCPLIGAGNPFGFQHNAHMGVDAQTGAFHSTGVPSQWLQPLGISPSDVPQDKENANPKAQTTKKHHRRDSSQAGASTLQESTPTLPYKPTMKTIPIAEKVLEPSTLSGTHQMRVAGRVVGWSWKSRYFVLGPKTLKVSRTEGSKPTLVLNLRDITNIDRTDLTDYCLMLEIKSSTQYFISFKHADDLYNWQDDLYSKSPLAGISGPTNFVHHVHIGYDAAVGAFTGMPEQWRPLLDGTDKVRLPTSVAPAPIAVR